MRNYSEQLDAATVSCCGLSKHLEKSRGEEEEERLRAWERMWVCLCGKVGRKKMTMWLHSSAHWALCMQRDKRMATQDQPAPTPPLFSILFLRPVWTSRERASPELRSAAATRRQAWLNTIHFFVINLPQRQIYNQQCAIKLGSNENIAVALRT